MYDDQENEEVQQREAINIFFFFHCQEDFVYLRPFLQSTNLNIALCT